jgi:small multidrug resistance pump
MIIKRTLSDAGQQAPERLWFGEAQAPGRVVPMDYLWLLGAILFEVLATMFLKSAEGFTRPLPSIVVAVGYAAAFYCLSQTLKTIPIGIAYAIWSGLGTVLIGVAGVVLYRQTLDRYAVLGMALIVAGVAVINLLSATKAH